MIENTTIWQPFKSVLEKRHPSPSTLTVIDFKQEMVIGFFMGILRVGGYSIEIIEVAETPHTLNVYFVTSSPRPGGASTRALTYPFHLIKTAKNQKPLELVAGKMKPCPKVLVSLKNER